MKYGSVCSGIEAATMAWKHLGWQCQFNSEIDLFPRAVLKHHYPDIPLHGDFTTIGAKDYGSIDLLVGGTPCQSFSIAGLRKGMDDDRGNLALEFLRLAERKSARWILWENVPGVLSTNEGRDFGSFLGGLAELGYGFAYRILDAQYCGVPQRRRRVFVVGYLGDWRPAAAVLFEQHCMQRHSAPSRETGEDTAGTIEASLGRSRGAGQSPGQLTVDPPICTALEASYGRLQGSSGRDMDHGHSHLVTEAYGGNRTAGPIDVATAVKGDNNNQDFESETFITHIDGGEVARTLRAEHDGAPCDNSGYDVIAFSGNDDGQGAAQDVSPTLRGMPGSRPNGGQSMAVAFQPRVARNDRGGPSEVAHPLTAEAGRTGKGDSANCIAFTEELNASSEITGALSRGGDGGRHDGVMHQSVVRRLTPIECERLQGFPDNFTRISWRGKDPENCPDGPRYKALGNSMAVPVMRWLGERIQKMENLL